MSLLTPTAEESLTPAQRKADAIRAHIRSAAKTVVTHWAVGFDSLWRRNDPGATLEALGTDAAECFVRSKAMHEFCIAQFGADHPVIVQEVYPRLQSLPAFTIHEDGRVTLDPVPEPEPVPVEDGE
jgi:hypothetical protein